MKHLKEYDELVVENVKCGLEFGEVKFEGGLDAPEIGFTDDETFVSFNDHCVDIIKHVELDEYGSYEAYIASDRFKQAISDTWVDRVVDR